MRLQLLNNKYIRIGLLASFVQSFCVSGSRFLLILPTFIVPSVSGFESLAYYDTFIVSVNLISYLITFGLDSGFALASSFRTQKKKNHLFVVAHSVPILFCLLLSVFLLFFFSFFSNLIPGWFLNDIYLSLPVALCQTQLLLTYSYKRFLSKAYSISLILLAIYFISILISLVSFFHFKDSRALTHWFSFSFVFLTSAYYSLIFLFKFCNHTLPVIIPSLLVKTAYILLPFSFWYLISSLTLYLRRPIERLLIVNVGSLELLGSYILVSRFAESIAMIGSFLSSGFYPLFISKYNTDSNAGQKLAKTLLDYYFASIYLIIPIALGLWIFYLRFVNIDNTELGIPLVFAMVLSAANLGGLSLTGQGFVLTKKSYFVGIIGACFILLLACMGYFLTTIMSSPLDGMALSLLFSSFAYIVVLVQMSERLAPIGYTLYRQIAFLAPPLVLSFALLKSF